MPVKAAMKMEEKKARKRAAVKMEEKSARKRAAAAKREGKSASKQVAVKMEVEIVSKKATIAPKMGRRRNNTREWKVEKIVGSKTIERKRFYHVKWANYPASANTWEPEVNLKNCLEAISDFKNGKA